jgi:hypothetical protein
MRTSKLFALLACAALGACNWTEFDDLSDQTWVGSTKPDVKSSDVGVAIQRGVRSGNGSTLVVIGAADATYSELVYDATGGAKLAATTLDLNAQFGIGNLDAQPILLADPTSDDTALAINAGGTQILVLTGAGQLNMHNLFVSPSTVDAATYMLPPSRTDAGHVGEAHPEAPLIASGDAVVGTFYSNVPNPQPTCKLLDGATAIAPRALGTVKNGAFDDVLAWGSAGKLYRYPGSVFHGCSPGQAPVGAGHDTGFLPGHGSQILSIGTGHVLLSGRHDTDDASLLQVFDTTTLSPVGGSVSLGGLRTAVVLDAGTQTYVVAGYPAEIVNGTRTGVVKVFPVSGTGGIDTAPVATLYDAQPDDNESFGRALAVVPFNGMPIIAVAANNRIFMYYRSSVYDETRQGR